VADKWLNIFILMACSTKPVYSWGISATKWWLNIFILMAYSTKTFFFSATNFSWWLTPQNLLIVGGI
jgi:hypothetical protein